MRLSYDLAQFRMWANGYHDFEQPIFAVVTMGKYGAHPTMICTNSDGCGLWIRAISKGHKRDFYQVYAPHEFRMPKSESGQRRVLREAWESQHLERLQNTRKRDFATV